MIEIVLHNKLWIRFVTRDLTYLRAVKEHFSDKVANYWFQPKVQAGLWDGTISVFDGRSKTLPYGLLGEVIQFHKEEFPNTPLTIAPEVKELFRPPPIDITFNLKFEPYDYQEASVRILLKYGKGIVRVATAGGKSLIIAYLIDILRKNKLSKKSIIIVPRIGLINQFKSDLIDYNFDENLIGLIGDNYKEYDHPVIVSTWQSLNFMTGEKKNAKEKAKEKSQWLREYLKQFDTVIVDEVHLAQSAVLKNILGACTEAKFRFGVTGTLHDERLDLLNTRSFLGPVLAEYSAADLADSGHISHCNAMMVQIKYDKRFPGSYDVVKNDVFNEPSRMEVIREIINNIDGTFLLLVGFVEKEGEVLEQYLKTAFPKRKVVFLHGDTSSEEREKWRKRANKEKDIILIATYGIFQLGINIPTLKYLILASPFKAKIRVLQSIGRVLRKAAEKMDGAFVIDLWDQVRTLEKHGTIRIRHYIKEKFNIKEYIIFPDDRTDLDLLLSDIKIQSS